MKSLLFAAAVVSIFTVSCSKKDEVAMLPQRPNPEARNQEGTKLLGMSRVYNGQVQWSTIYYVGNTDRILRIVDSVMNLADMTVAPYELGSSTYNYDASGKVLTIVGELMGTPITTVHLYDAAGRLIERQFDGCRRTYKYNQEGRVTEDSSFDATGHCIGQIRYTYDGNENVATEEEWQYDPLTAGLMKASTSTFIYDDKLCPFSSVNTASILFKAAPHNILVTNASFTNGNSSSGNYDYLYNNAGLPKIQQYPTATGVEPNITRYYYY